MLRKDNSVARKFQLGGAELNTSILIQNLQKYLETIERGNIRLRNLLSSRAISKKTYVEVENRLKNLEHQIRNLKETLEKEREFMFLMAEECSRILEGVKFELGFSRVLNNSSGEDWNSKDIILMRGIESLRKARSSMFVEKTAPPTFSGKEEKNYSAYNKSDDLDIIEKKTNGKGKKRRRKMKKTREKQNSIKIEKEEKGTVHCMNPWNKNCTNTDIEVTIYYKGELLPICKECWKEISEKDIEWSSF